MGREIPKFVNLATNVALKHLSLSLSLSLSLLFLLWQCYIKFLLLLYNFLSQKKELEEKKILKNEIIIKLSFQVNTLFTSCCFMSISYSFNFAI